METNVLGSILGSRAAMRVMSAAGTGRIFLIDGAGATGGSTAGSAAYGASKRALTQLKVMHVYLTPESLHLHPLPHQLRRCGYH